MDVSPPSDPAAVPRAATALLAAHTAVFQHAVAAGRATPLVLPYSLLGAFILPTLWLAVPHARRPWLYRTRWLVMAFVVLFNLVVVRHTSSANVAFAYGVGLMASWGLISNANLLVWKRPQFESARAVRVVRKGLAGDGAGYGEARNGQALHSASLRRRHNGETPEEKRERVADDGHAEDELVWEPFPEHASFWYRLNWALDLQVCFRGSGILPIMSLLHIDMLTRR